MSLAARPGQLLLVKTLDTRRVELAQAVRTWPDDFAEAAVESFGEELGTQMVRRYGEAFDEAYRADFTARQAAGDIRVLEELPDDGGLKVSLYYPVGGAAALLSCSIACL